MGSVAVERARERGWELRSWGDDDRKLEQSVLVYTYSAKLKEPIPREKIDPETGEPYPPLTYCMSSKALAVEEVEAYARAGILNMVLIKKEHEAWAEVTEKIHA